MFGGRRTALTLLVLSGTLGLGALAYAKANGGRRLIRLPQALGLPAVLEQLRVFQCAPPTLTQCNDPSYAVTRCGRYFAQQLRQGTFQGCDSACDLDNLGEAECTSTDFFTTLCGQLDRERAQISWPHDDLLNHPSRCIRYAHARGLSNQGPDGAGLGIPEITLTQEVIVPTTTTTDPGLSTAPPPGARAAVRKQPFHQRMTATGFSSTYWGSTVREQALLCNPTSTTERVLRSARLAQWDNNGPLVESCREYVYEKYYDYSLFQDRVRELCYDYRGIFDVAYEPATAGGRIEDWAIGTKRISGQPLRQKDNTPLVVQPDFPTTPQPKNSFFALKVVDPAERQAILNAWNATAPEDRPPHPIALFKGLMLLDADLHQRLATGQASHTYVESWQWHKDMNDSLAGYLDEELFEFDRAKERFEVLLNDRAALTRAYVNAWRQQNNALIQNLPQIEGLPNPLDEIYDPSITQDPLGSLALRQQEAALDRSRAANNQVPVNGLSFATKFNTTASPFNLQSPAAQSSIYTPPGTVAASAGLAALAGISASAQSGGVVQVPLTGLVQFSVGCGDQNLSFRDLLECLVRRIAQVDIAIEAELVKARELGCLDLSPGAKPCDWSPKLFAQHLEDPFTELREPDFKRCVEYTADNFSPLASYDFVVHPPACDGPEDCGSNLCVNGYCENVFGGVVPTVDGQTCVASDGVTPDDYRTSPTKLERYFKCYDQYVKDVVAYVTGLLGETSLIDPETGQPKIGKDESDSQDLDDVGNGESDYSDWFSAEIVHRGTWEVRGIPNNKEDPEFCSMNPYAYGQFRVGGKFLGIGFDLLNAEGRITSEPDTESFALLEVVGNEIINESEQLTLDSPDGVEAEENKRQTFFEAGATVVIVYIPISVKGGISGGMGAEVSFGLGVPADANGGCSNGNLGMSFAFTPKASVEGFASVSIDAYFIEVGVKITIVFIEFKFPFTISVSLAGLSSSTFPDAKLEVLATLDMLLEILSGRFSVFAEFCYIVDCELYEADLFRWDGLKFKSNLFTVPLEIKLGPLIAFLQAGGKG